MFGTQYSITADSPRWWWPSAAAGAVAITVAVAIPATARNAMPDDGASGWTARAGQAVTTDDTATRLCFMGRAAWNVVVHGPQPMCVARTPASEAACPPPPDIRYVGVPWVTPVRTGCASVDRWWATISPRFWPSVPTL